MLKFTLIAVATIVTIAACSSDNITQPKPAGPGATVVWATGDITSKVADFRTALGTANGVTPGEQAGGRREINWDGAGANPFDNKNDFAANFFNTNVKAGQQTPAVSRGIGVVFSDIDLADKTTLELFAQDGPSLEPMKAF